MVRLVHGVLILRLFRVQAVVLCVRVLHDLVHLDFVPHARGRVRVLKIVDSLLVWIMLMNIILRSAGSLTPRVRINASNSLS